jgi:iron(III) transport system substrate-binding protein
MDLQIALVREGHAAACASPNAALLPAGAVYRGRAFATTVEPLVTLVATADIGDAPAGSLAEIAELLRNDVRRFRGRVVAYDISRNGLGFLAMMHERRLRPGFDRYLEVLRQVEPRLHPWNPPLVDELARGRAALAAHVLGSYAQRAVDTHSALSIARSAYPAVGVSRIAFVSAHASHPRAAARFVDYLLGDEGQALLGRAGLFPIRRTPHADRGNAMRAIAAIPLDDSFDELLDRAARDDLLQRWRSAIGSPLPA